MRYSFVSPPAVGTRRHPQQPGGLLRLGCGRASRLHLRGAVHQEDDEPLPALRGGEARRGGVCHRWRQHGRARPPGGLGAGQEELQHGGHP